MEGSNFFHLLFTNRDIGENYGSFKGDIWECGQ